MYVINWHTLLTLAPEHMHPYVWNLWKIPRVTCSTFHFLKIARRRKIRFLMVLSSRAVILSYEDSSKVSDVTQIMDWKQIKHLKYIIRMSYVLIPLTRMMVIRISCSLHATKPQPRYLWKSKTQPLSTQKHWRKWDFWARWVKIFPCILKLTDGFENPLQYIKTCKVLQGATSVESPPCSLLRAQWVSALCLWRPCERSRCAAERPVLCARLMC